MGQVPSARPARPTARRSIILGGGPNRIGQGIEFDYCCCHACLRADRGRLRDHHGQLQPRDRLHRLRHLRPPLLRAADRRGRARAHRASSRTNGTLHGVIVQFGGQTPLKLANAAGRRRHPDPRHLARRHRPGRGPRALPAAAAPPRPRASRSTASPAPATEALRGRARDRLPGGDPPLLRARRPRHGDRPRRRAARPLHHATPCRSRATRPVLIDQYLPTPPRWTSTPSATATDVLVAGVMEHIEEAGVHSGDSACSLPPYSLDRAPSPSSKRQTEAMASALDVVGLMNVQFAIQRTATIYVLEVNPRASRTVPFVAKATGSAIAAIAAQRHGRRAAVGLPAPRPLPRRRRPRRPLPYADPMTLADPGSLVLGQGGGVAVRPLPRRRHPARPRDALDRRGHGPGDRSASPAAPSLKSPARRRHRSCPPRAALFVSVKDGDKDRVLLEAAAHPARPRLPPARHRRHRRLPDDARHPGRPASTRSRRAARTSSTP